MKVVLLEKIHEDAVAILESVATVELADAIDAESVARIGVDAAAIVTRGRGRIPRIVFESARELKCVARCGAGTDNIDVDAATERVLPVVFSPESTKYAVAEHALMLAMAVGRRLTRLDREVKTGNWEVRNSLGVASELYSKTLGIVGLGRIGSRIAELGKAFGMDVCYWSEHSSDERFTRVSLDELFRISDVISLNVALTSETKGMIGSRLLGFAKPTAILVNTSRGEVVDENALVEALLERRLAGAGFDVMDGEPPRADHPLFGMDNVIITPHVAAITDVAFRRMCLEVATQVARIVSGGEPDAEFVRNPQVLLSRR